jgi:hypothetical protein
MLNVTKVRAQFSGSITLGGYHTTNADISTTSAGKDTLTPDNVINPTFDLIYNWDISTPAQIKFELSLSPNIFTIVPSRSFEKTDLSATGNFYLSNIDEDKKPPPISPKLDSIKPKTIQQTPEPSLVHDTVKTTILIKPEQLDIAHIAAGKLADLSGLLDSFDYDDKGLSDDSSDVISDLKDSVSESVLALSEVLTSEIFTESIASVVTSETENQKKIFFQVPMDAAHKKEIDSTFDAIITLLKGAKPQGDIMPTPIPKSTAETATPIPASPSSEKNDMIAQALVHLQVGDKETPAVKEEDAPVLTLINTQTEFKDLCSQDVLLKEDLTPLTKKTLATLLTVPATYEAQNNKGTYISYSYSQFEFAPRLDIYSGKNFAVGLTYDLTKIQFPFDTVHVNDGVENKFRLDTRIQAAPIFVFSGDVGISTKTYDDPLKYFVPIKGKPDKLVSTAANFSHFFLGGGMMIFPADRFVVTVAGAITRSSALRPYLIDSTLRALTGRSRVGGTQNDDQYSYQLSRISIFSLWRIFLDIDFSLDYSYEDRAYSNQQLARVATKINPRPQPITIKRDDSGPQIGFDLAREFLFDSRLISIFTSFTPKLDVQSSNYISTVKLFSYRDVTSTLSFEFGF